MSWRRFACGLIRFRHNNHLVRGCQKMMFWLPLAELFQGLLKNILIWQVKNIWCESDMTVISLSQCTNVNNTCERWMWTCELSANILLWWPEVFLFFFYPTFILCIRNNFTSFSVCLTIRFSPSRSIGRQIKTTLLKPLKCNWTGDNEKKNPNWWTKLTEFGLSECFLHFWAVRNE